MLRSHYNRSTYIYTVKYIVSAFIIFLSGCILLKFPEIAGQGISDGIDLCLGTLIPSLLPFMIISSMAINLNFFDATGRLFNKPSQLLFRLPGCSLGIFILSITGGYPIGCKMIKELYNQGKITSFQGKRLVMFCINPGPAFAISSVGFYMLGSKKAGIILYLSVIFSSLLIGILTRFLEKETVVFSNPPKTECSFSFASGITDSISSGFRSTLTVCSWVIAFSALSRLIDIIALSPESKLFISSTLEVTNGCYLASGNVSIPVIAVIIGFGGICTHFQIMDTVRALKLKYKYFITSRIIHGALSAVICNALLKIYPVDYDVFSHGTLPIKSEAPVSIALSVCMLTMCILVMLGESYKIKIETKKIKLPDIKKDVFRQG